MKRGKLATLATLAILASSCASIKSVERNSHDLDRAFKKMDELQRQLDDRLAFDKHVKERLAIEEVKDEVVKDKIGKLEENENLKQKIRQEIIYRDSIR